MRAPRFVVWGAAVWGIATRPARLGCLQIWFNGAAVAAFARCVLSRIAYRPGQRYPH